MDKQKRTSDSPIKRMRLTLAERRFDLELTRRSLGCLAGDAPSTAMGWPEAVA
jgi:hypothetical protein